MRLDDINDFIKARLKEKRQVQTTTTPASTPAPKKSADTLLTLPDTQLGQRAQASGVSMASFSNPDPTTYPAQPSASGEEVSGFGTGVELYTLSTQVRKAAPNDTLVPIFDPNVADGDRLLYDTSKQEFTGTASQSTIPMFKTADGTFVPSENPTDADIPIYWNKSVAGDFYSMYSSMADQWIPAEEPRITSPTTGQSLSQRYLRGMAVDVSGTVRDTYYLMTNGYGELLSLQSQLGKETDPDRIVEINQRIQELTQQNVIPYTIDQKSGLEKFSGAMNETSQIPLEIISGFSGTDSSKAGQELAGKALESVAGGGLIRTITSLNSLPASLVSSVQFVSSYFKENGKLPTVQELLDGIPAVKPLVDLAGGNLDEVVAFGKNLYNKFKDAPLSLSTVGEINSELIVQLANNLEDFVPGMDAFLEPGSTVALSKAILNSIESSRSGESDVKIEERPDDLPTVLETIFSRDKVYQSYQLVFDTSSEQRNTAYQLMISATATGDSEQVRRAHQTLVNTYKYEAANLPRNEYSSWTAMANPDVQEQIYDMCAQLELQQLEPLDRGTIKEIIERVSDPGVEFVGSYIFDFNNLLNLPLGRGLAELSSAFPEGSVIARTIKSVPNIETKDIQALAGYGLRKTVSDTLKYAWDESFKYYKLAKYSKLLDEIPSARVLFDADSMFKLTTQSVGNKIYSYSHNFTWSLFGKKKFITADDINSASPVFGAYGSYINEARKAGKTSAEIVDDVLTKLKADPSAPVGVATARQVDSLIAMADAVDPSGQLGWDEILRRSYTKVQNRMMDTAMDELRPQYAERYQNLKNNPVLSAADITTLSRELDDELKAAAKLKVGAAIDTHILAEEVGTYFRTAFVDKHRAWNSTNILDSSLAGKIGQEFPKARGILNSANTLYAGMKSWLINNWLFRSAQRFLMQNVMENSATYAFQHPDGTMAGFIDILDFNNYLGEAGVDPALHMAEVRSTFKSALDTDFTSYLEQGSKPVGSFYRSFQKSMQERRNSWILDLIDKGKYDKMTDPTLGNFLSRSARRGLDFFGAWKDAGADAVSAFETSYRTKMTWRFYQQNTGKVETAILSEQLANVTDILKNAGASDEVIASVRSHMSSAWQMANGNADEYLRLVGLDDIIGGSPRIVEGVPDAVMKNLDADDMQTMSYIAEWYNAYKGSLGGKLTTEQIDGFFTDAKTVFSTLAENQHNVEGVAGTMILKENPLGVPLPDDVSKAFDAYETGKLTAAQADDIVDSYDNLFGIAKIEFEADETSVSKVKKLHDFVRPDKVKPTNLDETLRALNVEQYPRDAQAAMMMEQIKQSQDTFASLNPADKTLSTIENMASQATHESGKPMSDAQKIRFTIDTLNYNRAEYSAAGDALAFQSSNLLKKADDIVDTNPRLATELNRMDKELWSIKSKYTGASGWLFGYAPGYSILSGQSRLPGSPIHAEEVRQAWTEVQEFDTRAMRWLGDYEEHLNKALDDGTPLYVASRGEAWSGMASFDNFVFDPMNGNLKSVDFVFPNGTRKVLSDTNGNSSLFTHFKKMTGIETVWSANEPIVRISEATTAATPFVDIPEGITQAAMKNAVIPDVTADAAFFNTYLASEKYGAFPLSHWLNQILAGKLRPSGRTVEQLTAQETVSLMDELIQESIEAGNTYHADALKSIRNRIGYQMEYTQSLADPNVIKPIPISVADMPEDLRTWYLYNTQLAAKTELYKDTLDQWSEIAKGHIDDAGKVADLSSLGTDSQTALRKSLRASAESMTEMHDVAMYGGNLKGWEIEGAIPHMNLVMKDYATSTTNIDQFIKNFYWFWMFPSRGMASWARMVSDKPQLLNYYNKYLRYSRMSAYKEGAINSKGDPLPSKVGYIPILGSNMWVNPTSSIPILNYVFAPRAESAYVDEEQGKDSVWNAIDSVLYQTGLRGLRASPTMELALIGARSIGDEGYVDPYTGLGAAGTTASLVAEMLPIPKPLQDALVHFVLRKSAYPGIAKIWNPQVTWTDYLVEIELLKGLIPQLQNAKSEEERWQILQPYVKVDQALNGDVEYGVLTDPNGDRELYKLWNDASMKVQDSVIYKQNLVGWMTSIYPKYFTDGDLQINQIRNEMNFLVDSVNDVMGSTVFFPDLDQQQRYDLYSNSRYETPEGWAWQIRNSISFVTDPITGLAIEDNDERRKEIARTLTEQVATTNYYNQLQALSDQLNLKLRSLPVTSRSGSDPRTTEIWNWYWDNRKSIESDSQYAEAQRPWSVGYKPTDTIYDYWRNVMWKMIEDTRPVRDYDNNEPYADYTTRVSQWEQNLPVIVQSMLAVIPFNVGASVGTAFASEGQDFSEITSKLLQEASADGYEQWRMDNDSILEAISNAYDQMYMRGYYEAVGDLSGAMRQVANNKYIEQHPIPQVEQIVEQVLKMYPGRWTSRQIMEMLTQPSGENRSVLNTQQTLNVGKTDTQNLYSQAYDIWNWISPTRRSEFRQELALEGVNADTLDMFFEAVNADSLKEMRTFQDPAALKTLVDKMMIVADKLNITAPTGDELTVRAQAEQLNKQFNDMIGMEFGDAFMESEYYPYLNMDKDTRKMYRIQNPDVYERIQNYYDMRDQYAQQYPLWAEYYYYKTNSSGGSGYYRSRGGGNVKRGEELVTLAPRSSYNLNKLLGSVSQRGIPSWLPKGASSVLGSRIAAGIDLTEADKAYLRKLLTTHPELADKITPLIGEQPAPTTEETVA